MEQKDIYLEEINQYGRMLNEKEKPIARELFSTLLKRDDWDLQRLCFAIQLLGDRSIAKYRGLFFYPEFLAEVDAKVEELKAKQEKFKRDYEEWKKMWDSRPVIKIRHVEEKPKQKYKLEDF